MKKILLVPVLAATLAVAACNTSWIQTAEQYVEVLTPVAGEILQILVLAGVAVPQNSSAQIAAYSKQVTDDLTTVGTLLEGYNSSNATTTVQKINAACADAEQNLNAILTAAHITNPQTQQKVTAAVELAVTTITQLEALLPETPSPASLALARQAAKGVLTPGQVQSQFNKIFAQ
jgi:hypothetical protein